MKLEELLLNDNIKYEKTLFINQQTTGQTEYIAITSTIDELTNEKKYGVLSIIFESINKNLPTMNWKPVIAMEYSNIEQFKDLEVLYLNMNMLLPLKCKTLDGYVEMKVIIKNNHEHSSFTDITTNKDKFTRIENTDSYFIGTTDKNNISLFDITINDYIPEINYIVKNCDYFKSNHHYNNHFGQFHMVKNSRHKVNILHYNHRFNNLSKEIYNGDLISENVRYFIVKDKNSFDIFRKKDCELLGTYANDNITNMELCAYDDDTCDMCNLKEQEVVILTTKENTKTLLSITTKTNELSFIETNEYFEDLSYNFCLIPIDIEDSVEYEDGFSFNGYRDKEEYRINIRPTGVIETIKIDNNSRLDNSYVSTLKKIKN